MKYKWYCEKCDCLKSRKDTYKYTKNISVGIVFDHYEKVRKCKKCAGEVIELDLQYLLNENRRLYNDINDLKCSIRCLESHIEYIRRFGGIRIDN